MSIEAGRKALVTGGASGFGLAVARSLRDAGAKVAIADLSKDALDAARDDDGPALLPLHVDVTNAAQVREAVDHASGEFGGLDTLVISAGVIHVKPYDEVSEREWDQTLDVNLDGTWRCCEAVIPQMKKQGGGVIINVGSVTLRLGMANLAHYLASKGGVLGLTRGLARDLGPHGIRANCVHLGAVLTEGELRLFPNQADVLKRVEEHQALPGRLTPETVEPVFAFLASDDSQDVTGQSLTVDRGRAHD